MTTSFFLALHPGGADGSSHFWTRSVMALGGVFLLGLSLIVTILGMHAYYRLRGQPINTSVVSLVIGMCTGAIVFSDVWWGILGIVSPKSIQLDNKVRARFVHVYFLIMMLFTVCPCWRGPRPPRGLGVSQFIGPEGYSVVSKFCCGQHASSLQTFA
jgi:hypothetical protein